MSSYIIDMYVYKERINHYTPRSWHFTLLKYFKIPIDNFKYIKALKIIRSCFNIKETLLITL